MARFTAIEWQSFSLKKDIEIIVKKIQSHRTVQFSLLYEMALAIMGVALTMCFNGVAKNRYFGFVLLGLSIAPFIVLAIIWGIERCKERRPGSDRMGIRTFIDAFDNEIAYNVLISESYYTMLVEALLYNDNEENRNKISDNIIHFYYIQTSYYFNKAIVDLIPINNIARDVLSANVDAIVEKRLISLPRYKNIKKLLVTIFEYLKAHESIMGGLESGKITIDLNRKHKELLDKIDMAVSQSGVV
jgi:hypothetical protein